MLLVLSLLSVSSAPAASLPVSGLYSALHRPWMMCITSSNWCVSGDGVISGAVSYLSIYLLFLAMGHFGQLVFFLFCSGTLGHECTK